MRSRRMAGRCRPKARGGEADTADYERTLRAAGAWTDGRHAEDELVELDYDGHAPKSSNDPATALQPIIATPKRCKDAKELKERLTAWSTEGGRVRASIQGDR